MVHYFVFSYVFHFSITYYDPMNEMVIVSQKIVLDSSVAAGVMVIYGFVAKSINLTEPTFN